MLMYSTCSFDARVRAHGHGHGHGHGHLQKEELYRLQTYQWQFKISVKRTLALEGSPRIQVAL
jgi:hypothetical protein